MVSLVETLSKRSCLTIDKNEQISKLASILKNHNIGCLVVLDKDVNNPVGIVSERDLVKNFQKILNREIVLVKDIMTSNIISCDLSASSKELMEVMTKKKIRHLPIIDNNKLIGIVSIGDVVNRIILNYEEETKYLKEYINN
ncbi:MAG: CBS domain-containing protein [Pseudomonadota bacterium]|nr:CBS domain-containing protein [Pseudomonadota bacterium]